MKPLQPPDTHHLSAATGWVELGNVAEAKLEIQEIALASRNHPDVLEMSYAIHSEEKNWDSAGVVARTLTQIAPNRAFGWVHLAFALHEQKKTQEACDTIKAVLDQFRGNWLMRYNLACYECQLGNEEAAMDWLGKAFALGHREKLKKMACADPDLKPLWGKI